MRGTPIAALAAFLLVIGGCSADQGELGATGTHPRKEGEAASATDPEQATGTAPPQDGAASTAGVDTEASAAGPIYRAEDLQGLDGPLREQASWVLDHLAPGATGPSAPEVRERFAAEFLEQVPADQIAPILAGVREESRLHLTAVGPVEEGPQGTFSTRLSLTGEQALRVVLSVDDQGRIAGLLLQPGPPEDLPQVASWHALAQEFAALGGTTRLYVGQVSEGTCRTEHATAAEPVAAPSGSIFKLIVLAAVVEAIEADELSWDQELTITPGLKSLPSGQLQDRPDGSRVSVQEAATLMISISDNTATDLLMDAVGEQRLTDVVARISDQPERLTPLLTTREFFELGWNAPTVREQWASADPAARTALLATLPHDLAELRSNPFAVTEPVWQQGVGWFLTGQEICTAHAILAQQAGTPAGAPVRQILSANPGLPAPGEASYQGFKGGSAPGVLAYSFYLETRAEDARADAAGTGEVLVVQVSHDGPILPQGYSDLTQAGLALLVRD